MKSELRECIAIDSGVCYLFHTWIRKTNSDGEILVAVVEDSVGLMHEVKADNLRFTEKDIYAVFTPPIDMLPYEVKVFTTSDNP